MAVKLVFFRQKGCHFCAATKPHVTKFTKKYPMIEVMEIDLTEISEWPEGRWAPKGVPAFVLLRDGERPRTISGQMTLAHLEKWIGL